MRPSTWPATGRVTDAAIKVVNNVWWDTGAHARRRDGTCHDRCVPCAAAALRQALHDAGTPGVLDGPGHPSPPAGAWPPRRAGGDPTSGMLREAAATGGVPDPTSPASAEPCGGAAGDPTSGSG